MRVFAALPLPSPAREAITAGIAKARGLYPRVKWVRPEGMHLTLHFFGEVPEPGVAELMRVFDDPVLYRAPIRARLAAPGQFPARGSLRVLWVGMDRGVDEMREYWRLFESAVAPLGWTPDERGFTPHVTIARIGTVPVDAAWTDAVRIPALEFEMGECVLFQSLLGRTGAEYIPLRRTDFKKGST